MKIAHLFVILTVLTIVVNAEFNNFLGKKRSIIKQEYLSIAEALRKIPINNPECQVRLSSIASDYIVALNHGRYAVNNFLPNIAKDKFYEVVKGFMKQSNTIRDDLQNAISNDCALLKEKLAEAAEVFNKKVVKFENEQLNQTPVSRFVSHQVGRKYDMQIFALYKLKYQAILFEKSNKELVPDISKHVEKLVQIISSLPVTNPLVMDELRHTLQHLYVITAKCVIDLGDWIEINADRVNDVKIAQRVSSTLSQLFDQMNRAINEDNVEHLKQKFQTILQTGLKDVVTLADIEYPDKLGGEEYIRDCLMYGVTIGIAYSENLKTLLLDPTND